MCPPVVIAALTTLGVAQSVMSVRGQNAQARATEDAANDAARVSQAQNERRLFEQGQAISAKSFERMRQANRERAKIRAAAANQGLSGVSPSRALSISDVNTAIDIGRIYTNLDNSNAAFLANSQSIESTRFGRVSNARASQVGGLEGATRIGLGALQGFATGMNLTGTSLSDLTINRAPSTETGGTGGSFVTSTFQPRRAS